MSQTFSTMRPTTHSISKSKLLLQRANQILPAAVAVMAFVLCSARATAQNAAAIDQVDSVQQRRSIEQATELRYETGETAPELYPGESEDIGPQSVLAAKRRRSLFQGSADIQYYYTDNAFLDHSSRVPSGVMVSTAQAELAPEPYKLGDGEFAPYLGFRQQWFDFFQYHAHDPSMKVYDFNAQTAFVGEEWTWKKNWQFGAGFDYTRLMTTASYHQFYSEYVPRWDATYLIPMGGKNVLSLGYEGFYHITDASQFIILPENSLFDRLDQMFVAGFSWVPCDHFMVQPYYSFRYTHFTKTVHRDDYLNTVGVGAYYFFCKYCSARIFTSFDNRQSNVTQAQYHELAAGVGANVTLKF
jgi:hypothetical protein